jgi:DNA-directed RNA polymerase subunit A'
MKHEVHKKIDNILFGIFSPQQTMKLAAVKVVTPELYDREGYPVDGGLMDTRMGVIDPGLRCKTCGQALKDCTGHFGYIELARPIVHIKFVKQVYDLLRVTCKHCGRIKVPEAKMKIYAKKISEVEKESGLDAKRREIKKIILKYKEKSSCPHCNGAQEKIKLEKPYNFYVGEKRVSPIEIRAKLEKIDARDLELLGYSEHFRPEWTILTVMQIPPATMRPSITLESGERSEDDLTHKLGDIVRINQRLFENINAGAPEVIIEDLWDLLQYHVTTFFDNEVAQLPPARHRGGQALKTLTDRIKSKEGRIRNNLAGKRTDFSARSVISPDPLISTNQVGVPIKIAMNLTIPEMVTKWNIEYLKGFVKNGPKVHPGANYIINNNGRRKAITSETVDEILEELDEGYTVERHLIDNDIALFNRQPSLHKMSMMAHFVKVMPGNTLRLNPAVCNPYNADFDGDEMNLHLPQTEEARAEAEVLMLVETQIISPKDGLSVMGCIHDAITGNYLLTKELVLNKEEATDLLYSCGQTDLSRLPKKQKIDGRDVFSAILPENFNFIGKDKSGNVVEIVDGVLKSGYMDKANLGEGSGLMFRNIFETYGPEYTANLLNKISRLGIKVLARRGFSIGISDVDLDEETKSMISEILTEAETRVDELIEEYYSGTLEQLPGRDMRESLELKILNELNKARNKSGDIVMKNVKNSSALTMARSGARGNPLNMAQMSAVVGQQAFRGRRIESGYTGRTLPYFKKGDLGVAAHGFIRNNFKSGLTPHEFFFGAMTGRDALMDTALRTPKSGYLYRRLSNTLQDLKVEYDGTVRDTNQMIVQFKYGEDGLDVSRTKNGVIDVKSIVHNVMRGKK